MFDVDIRKCYFFPFFLFRLQLQNRVKTLKHQIDKNNASVVRKNAVINLLLLISSREANAGCLQH